MQSLKPGLIAAALWWAVMPLSQAAAAPAIISASDLNAACMRDGDGSAACSAYIAGISRGFYYATVSARAGYPAPDQPPTPPLR